jgi:hypothetical protein
MIAHFLAVYPPRADQPADDKPHTDVTSLAAKLAEGPSEAWEFSAWAHDSKKYLRVAASIAMRSATGDLRAWEKVDTQQIQDHYRVTKYAARSAIQQLKAAGIVRNCGGEIDVCPRDWTAPTNAHRREPRILNLIVTHVMRLETEISALTEALSAVQGKTNTERSNG